MSNASATDLEARIIARCLEQLKGLLGLDAVDATARPAPSCLAMGGMFIGRPNLIGENAPEFILPARRIEGGLPHCAKGPEHG